MQSRRYGIAALFFAFGIALSLVLAWTAFLGNMMSGMSDSASSGPSGQVAIAGVTVPYFSYFVSGTVAALTLRRALRRALVVLGHTIPFTGLAFVRGLDAAIFAAFNVVSFALFGAAWLALLKEPRKAPRSQDGHELC